MESIHLREGARWGSLVLLNVTKSMREIKNASSS